MSTMNYEGVVEVDLSQYCEEAYLNYALYVIKDRVLPYVGDGLKPVQRRIIYTMAIEHIDEKPKKKKSAYTVGQVLGRFHPHGDLACYEAMVIMAQDFSYRYPLISPQGNFGDVFKPKEFAAMRYTESWLSPFSKSLLTELNSGNVDWIANYNGDEREPDYLPARLPNILLNGTTGIAVGMATDIPPHNVNEVVNATCALIDNPNLTVKDLLQYIKGPDYPTGAEIINSPEEILNVYETGRGSFKQRAVWRQEKDQIIISEIPHQAAPSIIPKVAELIQQKKIQNVDDIRDDSNKDGTRLVIQLRSSRTDGEAIMNQLFYYTDLEKTHRVNLNVIGYNDKPAVKSLKEILTEWIAFRKDIVRKRYLARLEKLEAELGKVIAFQKAFTLLDRVIEIVRTEDDPKPILMAELDIDSDQANAILDLRIRNLSRLDEQELKRKERALKAERKDIKAKLADQKLFDAQVKLELEQAKAEYGDDRRSPIVFRQAASAADLAVETAPTEAVTVVLSKAGWIRCGKGHEFDLEKLSYKTGDEYFTHCLGMSNQPIVLLDSKGKVYNLDANKLPSMRGYGEAVTAHLKLEDNASIVAMYMGNPEDVVLVPSSGGYGFLCQAKDLFVRNKNGKSFVNLQTNAVPLGFYPLPEDVVSQESGETNEDGEQALFSIFTGKYWATFITKEGRVLLVDLADIKYRSKGRGLKLINIKADALASGSDALAQVLLLTDQQTLQVVSGARKSNIDRTKLHSVKGSLGNAGKKLVTVTDKTSFIVK